MDKLAYRAALEISTSMLKVNSLDFSPCGTKLAAGMDNGHIFVWDARTGNQYYPTLTSPRIFPTSDVSGPSVVVWLDETSFLCGFSDGYIATCCLQQVVELDQTCKNSSHTNYRLHVLRRQVTNEPVRYLAYDKEMRCVAVSGGEKIRLWNQKG